jgi:hypothetical protein
MYYKFARLIALEVTMLELAGSLVLQVEHFLH